MLLIPKSASASRDVVAQLASCQDGLEPQLVLPREMLLEVKPSQTSMLCNLTLYAFVLCLFPLNSFNLQLLQTPPRVLAIDMANNEWQQNGLDGTNDTTDQQRITESPSSNLQFQPHTTGVDLVLGPSSIASELPTQGDMSPGIRMGVPTTNQLVDNNHDGNAPGESTQNPPYILYSNLGPLMAPTGLQLHASSTFYPPPNQPPSSYQYPGIPPTYNMALLGPWYLPLAAHHVDVIQNNNALRTGFPPDLGMEQQRRQENSMLRELLSRQPGLQPTRKALVPETHTRLQALGQANHDDPLPRDAYLMVTTVKKLSDREAEFCRKTNGKPEVDRDGHWIRKFESLPRHLRYDMLNSRLLVRAELEGVNCMRDIIIARTDLMTVPPHKRKSIDRSGKNKESGKDGNDQKESQGEGAQEALSTPNESPQVSLDGTLAPQMASKAKKDFNTPDQRLERILSNAKHNYAIANHLGVLSGTLFKDQKNKTVLSQSVKDKLQKKSDYQWLFNTTQLIDLDKDRMFMIVPKEDTLEGKARPIGIALPRTLYPLPVPMELTGDTKLGMYRVS